MPRPPEQGDLLRTRPKAKKELVPRCIEHNPNGNPDDVYTPIHELPYNEVFGPVLCVNSYKRDGHFGLSVLVESQRPSYKGVGVWVDINTFLLHSWSATPKKLTKIKR